jgi:alanine dehydrogenase
VRPSLREIRVYSPTRANRERFAAEMTDLLKLEVRPVDNPRAAVEGADIVGMATNSVTPVAEADWLAPGAHVTCIKELELGAGMLERAALVVVHARPGRPANYLIGHGEKPILAHDPPEVLGANEQARRAAPAPGSKVDLEEQPDLGELVTGQVPLPPPGSPTCFVNTMGVGVQFAAIGSLAYERARERGLGHEIPTDWFLQAEHD